MKHLHFKDADEFKDNFDFKTIEKTDYLVELITEAIKEERESIEVYEFTFDDEGTLSYIVSLLKEEYEKALNNCIEVYREAEDSDRVIDTYLLLKEHLATQEAIKG